MTYLMSNGVELQAQASIASRQSDNHNTLTYQLNSNNRDALVVPAANPANPFGVDVSPWLWRPFAIAGTLPSYADPATGARKQEYEDFIQRYKLGARFDLTQSWTANTSFNYQRVHRDSTQHMVNITNLQAALLGQGGPSRESVVQSVRISRCAFTVLSGWCNQQQSGTG
jgi:iron complex outermembrane recepter protein